jgi:hypothetical protein
VRPAGPAGEEEGGRVSRLIQLRRLPGDGAAEEDFAALERVGATLPLAAGEDYLCDGVITELASDLDTGARVATVLIPDGVTIPDGADLGWHLGYMTQVQILTPGKGTVLAEMWPVPPSWIPGLRAALTGRAGPPNTGILDLDKIDPARLGDAMTPLEGICSCDAHPGPHGHMDRTVRR